MRSRIKKGEVNIKNGKVERLDLSKSGKEYSFQITLENQNGKSDDEVMIFAALNDGQLTEWLNLISNICSSKGEPLHLSNSSHEEKPISTLPNNLPVASKEHIIPVDNSNESAVVESHTNSVMIDAPDDDIDNAALTFNVCTYNYFLFTLFSK
jgi:hypothetical protein